MKFRRSVLVSFATATATMVGLVQAPAYAGEGTFHDAANDVLNGNGQVTTTAAGIDVRSIRVVFSQRGLRIVVHHKNLTNANAHETRQDGVLLDTSGGNQGPEWIMTMIGFNYQLYRIDSFAQANNPRPRMKRFCGDKVRIDVRRDTTTVRMPDRCFPHAHRVRAYGAFWSKQRGYSVRYDTFLGFREFTPWVTRR